MKNSKLVKAISELSAWELRHLSDFVHSPFFNKHDRLTALMELLMAAAPDFPEQQLDRHHLYRQLFDAEAYQEQKFKDLASLGIKLFKSFLAYYRLRQDEFAQGMALLEEMNLRNWEGEFAKTGQQVEKIAETQPAVLQEKLLRRLRLQEMLNSSEGYSSGRKAGETIQAASELLDQYYILARLKYGVEMANRRNVVGQAFDAGLLEPILAFLIARKDLVENHPAIRIYLIVYQLLTQAEHAEPFETLKGLLATYAHSFPIIERREIYAYAINYCIRQINQGKDAFLGTLLDLYQQALDDETLLNEGWLSQWDYKNIVTSGLKAKRFEWCEQFIEQYKAKIEPAARDNAYTYNLASLHLEQGSYKQALKLLQHVEFSDQFYHLGSKVMLLKSYYELQEHEALLHLCETFRMYLKRNTDLSKYHQTINMNLIALARKLADLQSRWPDLGRKERELQLEKMRTAIAEKGNVAQKAWLIEKLEALQAA